MEIIKNDHVIFCDIDDTLIEWFPDPQDPEVITIGSDEYSTVVKPKYKHIDLLKHYKAKHKVVIVWSKSGYEWADTVIKALDLEEYVDFIMSKPEKYVDDLDANEWMERVDLYGK